MPGQDLCFALDLKIDLSALASLPAPGLLYTFTLDIYK